MDLNGLHHPCHNADRIEKLIKIHKFLQVKKTKHELLEQLASVFSASDKPLAEYYVCDLFPSERTHDFFVYFLLAVCRDPIGACSFFKRSEFLKFSAKHTSRDIIQRHLYRFILLQTVFSSLPIHLQRQVDVVDYQPVFNEQTETIEAERSLLASTLDLETESHVDNRHLETPADIPETQAPNAQTENILPLGEDGLFDLTKIASTPTTPPLHRQPSPNNPLMEMNTSPSPTNESLIFPGSVSSPILLSDTEDEGLAFHMDVEQPKGDSERLNEDEYKDTSSDKKNEEEQMLTEYESAQSSLELTDDDEPHEHDNVQHSENGVARCESDIQVNLQPTARQTSETAETQQNLSYQNLSPRSDGLFENGETLPLTANQWIGHIVSFNIQSLTDAQRLPRHGPKAAPDKGEHLDATYSPKVRRMSSGIVQHEKHPSTPYSLRERPIPPPKVLTFDDGASTPHKRQTKASLSSYDISPKPTAPSPPKRNARSLNYSDKKTIKRPTPRPKPTSVKTNQTKRRVSTRVAAAKRRASSTSSSPIPVRGRRRSKYLLKET